MSLGGNGVTCPMHPIIESAIERIDDTLGVSLIEIRRDLSVIMQDRGATRVIVQQTADQVLGLGQRMDEWIRGHERIDEVRREDTSRRIAALEAESEQWQEDTQSQTREALATRAKRAEGHVEQLATELRQERDLAAKREQQLADELRLERARRDSLRAGKASVEVEKWKATAVITVAVVSSLVAIGQALLR